MRILTAYVLESGRSWNTYAVLVAYRQTLKYRNYLCVNKKYRIFAKYLIEKEIMNKTITTRFNSMIEKKVGLPIASIRRMCSE